MSGSNRERLMKKSSRKRFHGGSGVYHERDLTDRETVEQSPLYQEVLRPAGICYTTGMSVQLPVGEAAICIAFEEEDAPGFSEEGVRLLDRLLPAFEAGVVMHHRLTTQRRAFLQTLDRLGEALYICGADGQVLHLNKALRQLLLEESEEEVLLAAIQVLADKLLRRRFTPDAKTTALVDMLPEAADLETSGACYRLTASYAPPDLLGGEAVIVRAARTQLTLPSAMRLAARYGLTPRQAQVALLVAQGYTNKELAAELVISPGTAKRHVSGVMRKLDVASRQKVLLKLLCDG